MKQEHINEMKRIVEEHIPLGNESSLCHVFICSLERCVRCQDALIIRKLIEELEIYGHIGR